MYKFSFLLATVLLSCAELGTAQVKPSAEIGRVTVQVPLLSNGKPVMSNANDQVEVADVQEIKPDKVVPPLAQVPPKVQESSLSKVRRMRAIAMSPVLPNHGIRNPVALKSRKARSAWSTAKPHSGRPKPWYASALYPKSWSWRPKSWYAPAWWHPRPMLPKLRKMRSVVTTMTTNVPPASSTVHSVRPKSAKNCYNMLVTGMLATTIMPMPPTPVENCDELCTKFELNPICAYNGICIHEFPNQCVMDTFNCKHRDLSFRAVDEDVCNMSLCARRCTEEDLKV
ncbi:uncharacterized protein LOC108599056 [Drosophila busckii]|uniref:uncharacterized protein LOC108599056 n=1 Tax=Drosophila busckii TaxID=30019 RepID=UPI00083EE4F2|nr:uncharacterized protein LOC108599056 [Drosophila busckii]